MPDTTPAPAATPSPDASTVVRVALPLPLPGLFDYLPGNAVGPDLVGCRLRVPFGSRELVGVAAEVGLPAGDTPELRTVLEPLDRMPLFHGELLASLRWLAR